MDDEITLLLERVRRCPSPDLAQLLASITLELTIRARGTYVARSTEVEAPEELRALNECQHFLLGLLRRLLFQETVDVDAFAESLGLLLLDPTVGQSIKPAVTAAFRQLELHRRSALRESN